MSGKRKKRNISRTVRENVSQRTISSKSNTTRLLTNKWVNIDLQTTDIPKTTYNDYQNNSNLHRIHDTIVSTPVVKYLRKANRRRNLIRSPIFGTLVNLKQRL